MAAVTQVRILVTAVTFFFLSLSHRDFEFGTAGFVGTLVMKKRQWYSGEHSCLPSS